MLRITYLFIFLSILFSACTAPSEKKKKTKLKREDFYGETMGTTFKITYLDSTGLDIGEDLTLFLEEFNQAVSTYIKSSQISQFNQKDSLFLSIKDARHFVRNYTLAKDIYTKTDGWFDPTVMPLVNYWGFGYTEKKQVKEADADSIKKLVELVDFESVVFEEMGLGYSWKKTKKALQLDFSALAKGDAVDEVGRLLEEKGVENYFVEIGGEIRARGNAMSGTPWRTGIRAPKEGGALNDIQVAIEVVDQSIATSGNYVNFFEDEATGQKYAHTINPKTGYPEKNNLLSVSVFTAKCGAADALATAFMAMGYERAYKLVQELEGVDAFFIYSARNGKIKQEATAGIAPLFEKYK